MEDVSLHLRECHFKVSLFLLYFYLYPEDFFGGVKENWIRPRVNAVQNTS